jgi:hypothetical protein
MEISLSYDPAVCMYAVDVFAGECAAKFCQAAAREGGDGKQLERQEAARRSSERTAETERNFRDHQLNPFTSPNNSHITCRIRYPTWPP